MDAHSDSGTPFAANAPSVPSTRSTNSPQRARYASTHSGRPFARRVERTR